MNAPDWPPFCVQHMFRLNKLAKLKTLLTDPTRQATVIASKKAHNCESSLSVLVNKKILFITPQYMSRMVNELLYTFDGHHHVGGVTWGSSK